MVEIVYDMEAARREEAIYRTPAAVDRRQRIRQALSPTSGETVLSLGSGPGFEPLELATHTDVQSVIGVDQSRAMLELARDRCASTENVSLIEGEATALPLSSESVDAAVSVQVYGYVEAISEALDELVRVIQPGGRAVVYVTDWEMLVWRIDDSELAAQVADAWQRHCQRPRLGSELATPLRKAGFEIEAINPYMICNTSLDGTFAGHLVTDVHRHVADTLDQQTADHWQDAIRVRERAGESFFSLTGVLYHLSKPPL